MPERTYWQDCKRLFPIIWTDPYWYFILFLFVLGPWLARWDFPWYEWLYLFGMPTFLYFLIVAQWRIEREG